MVAWVWPGMDGCGSDSGRSDLDRDREVKKVHVEVLSGTVPNLIQRALFRQLSPPGSQPLRPTLR